MAAKETQQPIDGKILRSIRARRSAQAFSAKDFVDIGRPDAIRQALSRLARDGALRRIRRGVYDLPRQHPILGQTAPDPTAIVTSLLRDTGAQWQFTGAYAANQLGLSEQVPAKIIIYTDASPRKIRLGKLTLTFRKVVPRSLLGAGRPAGLVVQALRHLKRHLTPRHIAQLRQQLDADTKAELASLAPQLPAWMRPHLDDITT
ncbi:MAG: hypothetical protein C0518_11110 [Opitutus sp.]|nr:hypothetical protein [Opitutus sp.]